ncbi:MAG: alkene reductase [Proteobacteria bacterium]|nr:alkene reductase [Pseudomonadota bacterium]
MASLFDPLKAGALTLSNRVVMAPLTRARAGASRVPNDLMAEYYAQRASAGLIVSEATAVCPMGYGWRDAPAMYTDAQEEGWCKVTKAVHDKGGQIVLQLWHMGRVSHPDFLDGALPHAPSAIAADGEHKSIHKPYVVPHAMTVEEIAETVKAYADAAKRAVRAGFDGVEIHGANGYLIDQFLRDGSNLRSDDYGGSIEKRARFMLEVTGAVCDAIGADRTGIRLTAMNGYNSMNDSDLESVMVHAASALREVKLAYLHVREPASACVIMPKMKAAFRGVVIGNDGYDGKSAQAAIDSGICDAVAFGVKYIANPDLVERLRAGVPLNTPDSATFYKGTTQGYTDYPKYAGKAA